MPIRDVATGVIRLPKLGSYGVGAIVGGLLVGLAPAKLPKPLLGVIPTIPAIRTFRG